MDYWPTTGGRRSGDIPGRFANAADRPRLTLRSEMRWFNEAADEADDDGAWERLLDDYFAHVQRIAPHLPPDLARLALEPQLNLHDARFERVEIDLDNSTATIVVNAGDLQAGYRRISLAFTGARVVPDNLQLLGYAVLAEFRPRRWSRYPSVTEIRAQEVDLAANGRYTVPAYGRSTSSPSSSIASASRTWPSQSVHGRE